MQNAIKLKYVFILTPVQITVIKVILDSGSDGDLMFHEKGTSMHFPYLARQVPNSWHMLKEEAKSA